jgi:hypothetical protein
MVNNSGNTSTVAGTGSVSGFSGDGGAATSAKLNVIDSVVVDMYGRIFIADTGNHVIRMVNNSGVISTVAGNGTVAGYSGDGGAATSAKLKSPSGVFVTNPSMILLIADTGNHVIRMVTMAGIISTVAGGMVAGYSGDGMKATDAKLNSPFSVVVDQIGRIFIADTGNHVIRMVNNSGIISTVTGTGTVSGFSGDFSPATNATLNFPKGVSVDKFGQIFIADSNNQVIRMVGTDGNITTIAGTGKVQGFSGDGKLANKSTLNFPKGVFVDQMSGIFISDTNNHAIRRFLGTDDYFTIYMFDLCFLVKIYQQLFAPQ